MSLIELVVSMAAAMAILVGAASTVAIASRASNPNTTPTVSILESGACLGEMVMDLQYAITVTSATSTGVTVTVADRNNDAVVETIRYAWAGAGQPLTRQHNGGASSNMLASVQSFAIEYYPSAVAPQYLVLRLQGSTLATSAVETYVKLYNQ